MPGRHDLRSRARFKSLILSGGCFLFVRSFRTRKPWKPACYGSTEMGTRISSSQRGTPTPSASRKISDCTPLLFFMRRHSKPQVLFGKEATVVYKLYWANLARISN
jgi:hypothetical protein